MDRWKKIKSGFVSEKSKTLGTIALLINMTLCIAFLIYTFSNYFFEYDLPLFSFTLTSFLMQLCDDDHIGRILTFPLLVVSLGGYFMMIYSLLIEPRKKRKWYGAILIIGVIYVVFDLSVLIAARFLNSPLVCKSFFWIQMFFAILMLLSFILKFHIWDKEMKREQLQ